ncbi:uncharacterized protein B0H64DRAFT_400311 [Chaetomium fimeti]|uniref:Uncharacterized protein n=1 Tax=Chaetomium fimeti TaxID=1854472 RepID=A0AAE0LQN3_9PEZI|nr:hypothetical protein B0H64DRAFT_400311 [Chaetomium fimeti]
MGDVIHERDNNGTTSSASARDICEEFLKLLSRKEVEQPLICQNLCLCAQFWRYQHYLLPRWEWGITKLVCLDLGSFRNTQPNGGPFHHHDNQNQQEPQEQQQQQQKQQHTTYGSTIRDPALRAEFNTRPLSACDALQTMLRHAAAVEVAASLALCSSGRGVEHELVKHYFKRLEGLAEEGEKEQQGKATDKDKKLSELPPMAGYAGNRDLVDVPVWFWGGGYTAEDREALKRAAGVMRVAQLPPVEVVGGDVDEVCELVDGRTLVYTVGLDGAVWREVLRRCEPAAVIGGGCASDFER